MAELPIVKSPVVAAIEAAYVAGRQEEERGYIGASVVATDCERRLWYSYRWATQKEQFDGRMLRLFATGHSQEERLIDDLRSAGVTVWDVDPATGEQWAVIWADGHGGTHLDGRCIGVPGAEKTEHLLECKSHNEKSFGQLKKHGLKISHPVHWGQCQIGMHGFGLTRCLYLAVNKDTDELHAVRIEYDAAEAIALVTKVERVVGAETGPSRISEDPEWFQCRFCPSQTLCHGRDFARRNCRTCLHSSPVKGGGWRCDKWSTADESWLLDIRAQRVGCPSHLYLPSLVGGEQVDVDEEAGTVTYRMPDGAEWQDGVLP